MKLAVMADLHVDLVPGAQRRLTDFYTAAQRENAGYDCEFGGFCRSRNRKISGLLICGKVVPCRIAWY